MSEEKKLTDEEIAKAIEKCFAVPMKCEDGCPYFNKHGRNFCVEDKAFYKDMKRIVQEHSEQKAEIERLTEENKKLVEEIDLEVDLQTKRKRQIITESQEFIDELANKNAELQKQVDELKERAYYRVFDIACVSVDTIDEICKEITEGE